MEITKMRVRFCLVVVAMLATGSASAWAQGGSEPSERPAQESATAVAPAGSKDRPIRVSSGVMAGLSLHRVLPVHPGDAKKINGVVVMAATIDDHGKIVELSAISGPEMLRDACLDAVKQWTYKPYLLNGKPVFVKTQITINMD
jgi:protein TonB